MCVQGARCGESGCAWVAGGCCLAPRPRRVTPRVARSGAMEPTRTWRRLMCARRDVSVRPHARARGDAAPQGDAAWGARAGLCSKLNAPRGFTSGVTSRQNIHVIIVAHAVMSSGRRGGDVRATAAALQEWEGRAREGHRNAVVALTVPCQPSKHSLHTPHAPLRGHWRQLERGANSHVCDATREAMPRMESCAAPSADP